MVSALISRLVVLFVGTLYPAYGSYKAIRSKNPREYVNWIMYWICFALFTFFETFSDIFLAFCVPFYYELKIIFLAWLLCPATKGSSILYRNFVHPRLVRHEQDIDDMISTAKENGVTAICQLGSRGAQYASQLLASTAIRGQQVLLQQLQRSYSHGDIRGSLPAILSSVPNGPTGPPSLVGGSDSLNNNDKHEVRRRVPGSQTTHGASRRQVVSESLPFSDEEDDDLFMIDEEPISLQEMQEIAGGANHRDEPGSSGIGGNTSKDEPPKLPAKKRDGNHLGYTVEMASDDSSDETEDSSTDQTSQDEEMDDDSGGFVNDNFFRGVTRRRGQDDVDWKPFPMVPEREVKRHKRIVAGESSITTRAAAKASRDCRK
ncbi:receptor expression-enhancing protein 2-like isoform X2 [Varroa destructor]|uniref:Receptor expression-enhancing protein n=2 Tax=Varroa TaxID=62624 RepID=A0A7M7JK27_VARDE|nr:receptor expression-enhancing protein 2-like isoform X2 [Varroa destructor]XP_022652891.1 receptor expression-enhancing protein 2-like isoform X2 [Varroa destructor]